MEFRAVCSEREMTAKTKSCLTGRGDSSWLDPLEPVLSWGSPSWDDVLEVSDGGWPLDLGGGVGKVW